MNKYKVEFTEQTIETYVIDVLAESEQEATDKASEKLQEMRNNGTLHFYQSKDSMNDTDISAVYDVTNTDDPFNEN